MIPEFRRFFVLQVGFNVGRSVTPKCKKKSSCVTMAYPVRGVCCPGRGRRKGRGRGVSSQVVAWGRGRGYPCPGPGWGNKRKGRGKHVLVLATGQGRGTVLGPDWGRPTPTQPGPDWGTPSHHPLARTWPGYPPLPLLSYFVLGR